MLENYQPDIIWDMQQVEKPDILLKRTSSRNNFVRRE